MTVIFSHAATRHKFRLTYETVNSRVVQMEYAVRGLLPQEAKRIETDIKQVRADIHTHYASRSHRRGWSRVFFIDTQLP